MRNSLSFRWSRARIAGTSKELLLGGEGLRRIGSPTATPQNYNSEGDTGRAKQNVSEVMNSQNVARTLFDAPTYIRPLFRSYTVFSMTMFHTNKNSHPPIDIEEGY